MRRLCHEHLEDRSLLAVLAVTSALDSGEGSLREAIEFANDNEGPHTIEFDSGLANQTITLTTGELHITDDLTINGLGADQLTISGNNSSRIFLVDDGDSETTITVSISGLLLENGRSVAGGAIFNRENLTVEESTLANNSAAPWSYGGGIFSLSFSTLTIINSTLTNNSGFAGGGIANYDHSTLTIINSTLANNSGFWGGGINSDQSTLTITNSTLANNSGFLGGGIYNYGYNSPLTVTNSTLANNSAEAWGGGITNLWGTLSITNSTLANNSANSGGGGIANDGPVTVHNSVLGGNTAPMGPDVVNLYGTIIAAYNVIEDGADSDIVDGDNGNQVGVNPLLDPAGLQDNGGLTQTIALLAGSPAINAGNNVLAVDANGDLLEFDQRGSGFPRFVGTVDVGALEMQPTEQIDAMLANIQLLLDDGALNGGQADSLSVKFDQIQQRLDAGQTHVALNQLNAFTNHVTDLIAEGVLTEEEGQLLLDAAEDLRTSLTVTEDEAAVDVALADDELLADVLPSAASA